MSLQLPLPCPAQTVLLPQVVLMLYSHWSWAQPCGGGLCIPGCFVNSQTRCSASRQMGRHRGVSIGANWWRRQLGLCAAPEPNQTRPLYPGTLGLGGGDRRWMPSLAGPRSPQGCPIPLRCSGSCSLARFQPRGGKGCGSQSPAFGTRVGGDALQRVFWSCRDKFR